MGFNCVQAGEQGWWIKRAGDNHRGVGIYTLRWAYGGAADYRRLGKDVDIRHLKRVYGFRQNGSGRADQAVPLVRAERNEVEIGQSAVLGQPAIKLWSAITEKAHAGTVSAGLVEVEGCND